MTTPRSPSGKTGRLRRGGRRKFTYLPRIASAPATGQFRIRCCALRTRRGDAAERTLMLRAKHAGVKTGQRATPIPTSKNGIHSDSRATQLAIGGYGSLGLTPRHISRSQGQAVVRQRHPDLNAEVGVSVCDPRRNPGRPAVAHGPRQRMPDQLGLLELVPGQQRTKATSSWQTSACQPGHPRPLPS
jgi:hypothetical protein